MINIGIASEINSKILENLDPRSSYVVHIGSTASSEAIGSVGYNSVKAAIVAYVKLGNQLDRKKSFCFLYIT